MAIPSLMQKSFTDVHDEFLFACSHGDYLSVERLLRDNIISHNDICRTIGQEKLSPIVIAIEHHHLEIIKILLDYLPYSDFREALLLAIYLDLTKIAQLIMEHDTFKCFYGTFADWETNTVDIFDDSHFAAIRPIHLAAQYNRTTVLYEFLKRVPHNIECNCNECKSAGLNDSLRYSQLRLSAYRSLSSDVYLALVSEDPIASAFDLSYDLSQLIKNEPNLASEYLYLFNQISQFTVRLVDLIRNQTELELLLTVQRLNSAIEHNQQEFITHTHTQQRLTDIWYQQINLGRTNTLKKRFLASIYYILIFIPMYIGYFWFSCYFEHQCRWYFEQPAIQALVHSITYQIFLLIVILSGVIKLPKISLKTEYPQIYDYYNHLLSIDEKTAYYQKSILSYFKILVLIWMTGYVYRNINKMIRLRRWLEIMDLLLTILFILYIFLFTIAAIQVHLQWQFITNIDKWKQFERLDNENKSSNEYIKMKNRFMFIDPTYYSELINIQIIADGIFSLTIVCCIIHLCFFLIINEYFGPLLVSLMIMSKTIYRWFIFILIFIFAYETSFLSLFSYYFNDQSYINTTINLRRRADISLGFGDLKLVTINVLFSLFGISKNELTQTYINIQKNLTNSSLDSTHYYFLNSFTSVIGSIIYGSFAFCARIIVITMIIAYIKRIYNLNKQEILNNWKFARAKIYMTFISKDPDILPVPLNLIPTPRHIKKIFQKKIVQKKIIQKKYLRNLNYSVYQYNSSEKPTIDNVMNFIVSRFLMKYHPFDTQSLKRTRQIQCKEELSNIRHHILNEIQSIQQTNRIMNKYISTVFFNLDQY